MGNRLLDTLDLTGQENILQTMPFSRPFKYIVAKYFFSDYAPGVKNFKHKLRGKDGNGNPIEFSKEDQKEIKKGLKQLFKDLA